MLDLARIEETIPQALTTVDLPGLGAKRRGKVRDMYRVNGRRLLITTDRLSAFDRVLAAIPYKGQVLNQLSAFWFETVSDLVAHHCLSTPDPNATLARDCTPLPVEVVVRGYITGVTGTSLWANYAQGERVLYGYILPDGLAKNDPLSQPLITPTTKATTGHDERISSGEVVERGLVSADRWEQIQQQALAVFARGQEVARENGLILVDTKYEFGLSAEGELMLIDELHTPDSSRFWLAESYQARRAAGLEPENFDKEFLRLWYVGKGYRGEGEPPPLPDEVIARLSQRYIAVYERLTGLTFVPADYPAGPRIVRNLRRAGLIELE
jgi:phosphoribosylaminoimidazole-succinocarboxamide synthase